MRHSRPSFARFLSPFTTFAALASALVAGGIASTVIAQHESGHATHDVSRSQVVPPATAPKAPPTPVAPTKPATPPAVAPATAPPTQPPASPPTPPAAPNQLEGDKPITPGATDFVLLSTSMGDILLELDRARAPLSVANFLHYVESGFYSGTIFHRVISSFVIQGGGFTEALEQKKTDAPIKNEWQNGLKNTRGTLAMARQPAPDSATTQFYINVADNPPLDEVRGGAAYAVFGQVVKGMDVVDRIRAVPVMTKTSVGSPKPNNLSNCPSANVTVTKATKVAPNDAKKIVSGG